MTSAVPYEPDDFDNNPFAESSVIIQPEVAASSSVTAQAHDSNTITSPKQTPQGVHSSTATTDHPTPALSKQQQLDKSRAQAAQKQSKEDEELNSPFHAFPTDNDLKRYLPERINKNSFSLAIKVVEIEKNGTYQYKNPVVKINAQVKNIPGFRKQLYKEVRRTFKELEALYRYLIFNNIEVLVPALPNIPALYNPGSTEFINSLAGSLQDWFIRICSNPILIRNQEFVLFLEQNDFSYTPSKTKPSSNSVMATGIKRKTLKQFQPPYDASQDLAEYRPMVKSIYLQSQKLLEKLDKLLRLQKQSSSINVEFYTKMSELAPLEENPDMGKIWVRFNKIMQLFNEFDLIEELTLNASLTETFQLISDDCYNIKEALTNRHLLMRELINAEENTRKKHSTINKLKNKSILDPERVEEAIRSLELATNYEKELKYQVKRTTYEMLVESQDYINYLVNLIKRTFKSIAQHQIQQERKKLQLLSANKLIHPQESLGRLGRESLPLNTTNAANLDSIDRSVPIKHDEDSWNSRPKKAFENNTENFGSLLKDDNGPDELLSDETSRVDAKSAASLLAGASF
ncbi:hypothetical protein CANARDRAFT_9364 [[Candida] arabinofermentans NRRL YB-2248]|uniref:PX domain-containing protein n=1 Tax=[Candida] arabinofermentans NRRL YB-2248 TaxID=983967 RepID=A0A1E4SWE9_9ASCO|nr:hypothetical protein CANARDRAFT_9364 [[Candida] arabinofermentans NRRL YB-2248]